MSELPVVTGKERAQAPAPPDIFAVVRAAESGFAAALPAGVTAERFTRVALTTLRNLRPDVVRNLDRASVMSALMLSAQLGLEPGGPLGHAYLVPYGRELTFIPGYKGLIELARRSGSVRSITAHAVHDGDRFAWSWGLDETLEHVPTAHERTDPANITHVYAVARLTDGDPVFVVLTRAEVERYRARSKAGKGGPWVTDWEAMALKTAVRRLMTWLPLSAEAATVATIDAVNGSNAADVGFADHDHDLEPVAELEPQTEGGK